MNNVKITRVDNGLVLELTKLDFLSGKPEVQVLVFTDLAEVITFLEENF